MAPASAEAGATANTRLASVGSAKTSSGATPGASPVAADQLQPRSSEAITPWSELAYSRLAGGGPTWYRVAKAFRGCSQLHVQVWPSSTEMTSPKLVPSTISCGSAAGVMMFCEFGNAPSARAAVATPKPRPKQASAAQACFLRGTRRCSSRRLPDLGALTAPDPRQGQAHG